eukprot:2831963-Amphidinium_carterae.1
MNIEAPQTTKHQHETTNSKTLGDQVMVDWLRGRWTRAQEVHRRGSGGATRAHWLWRRYRR